MKNRLVTFIMVTVLTLSLTACGGSEPASTEQSTAKVESSTAVTAEPTTAPTQVPTPEPTPEPTPQPTLSPAEAIANPVVYFNGKEFKLGGTLDEFLAASGLDISNAIAHCGLTVYHNGVKYYCASISFEDIRLDLGTYLTADVAPVGEEGEVVIEAIRNHGPIYLISQNSTSIDGHEGLALTIPGDIAVGGEISATSIKELYGETATGLIEEDFIYAEYYSATADYSGETGYFISDMDGNHVVENIYASVVMP